MFFRARDRGVAVERPRSWHSSKSANFDNTHQEDTMRSPESGYTYNTKAHHRLSQPKDRSSKGWVYNPRTADTKNSLFSGGSRRSSKSARLSVSSSRSSGTISSSRGSLENLVDGCEPLQTAPEIYPQIILSSGNRQFKHNSPSQPVTGIVSQQRNIFERLCQQSASPGSETKTFDFSNSRRISSDSSDAKYRYSSIRLREKNQTSSQSSAGCSRPMSVTVSTSMAPAEKEKRKRSYATTVVSPVSADQENPRSLPRQKNSTVDLTRKTIEKEAQPQDRHSSQQPQKVDLSSRAVKNLHYHSKSYSALSTLAHQVNVSDF